MPGNAMTMTIIMTLTFQLCVITVCNVVIHFYFLLIFISSKNMQKQKENIFLDKFRLLNSQKDTEEIIWSLSDSSEYEESALNEKFNNLTNKTRILKRKRKRKAPNNLSNLNITVLDTSKSGKMLQKEETSPILMSKVHQKCFHQSPILASSQTSGQSTVLLQKNFDQKSPLLSPLIKTHSVKTAGTVKKKLFIHQQSEIGPSQDTCNEKPEDILTCGRNVNEENTSKAKLELTTKVKTFFDNHFSSESSSQNSQSISDIQTQRNSTKTSEENEILTCITHTASNNSISKENQSEQSSENTFYTVNRSKKKIRYKKDGLAYRLNNLLRKRNACLSLWHHERFLAANSNFVIPKEENIVFRIQKVHFKYGYNLLEVVDLYECDYLILINNCYVSDSLISDTIIKVYEPYKVVQYSEDTKLLVNVCRYECCHYKA